MSAKVEAAQGRPGLQPWPVSQECGSTIIDGIYYKVYWSLINAIASGVNLVVAGVPSYRIRVIGIVFTCDGNQGVAFQSGTVTDSDVIIPEMQFANRGGPGMPSMLPGWWMETGVGDGVIFNMANASDVRGFLLYVLIPKGE